MAFENDSVDVYGNLWQPRARTYVGRAESLPGGDEQISVALLKELAGDGPALELGIGGGRIALPLAAEGIRVDGIDRSSEMIARLREQPGGSDLHVSLADFADVD